MASQEQHINTQDPEVAIGDVEEAQQGKQGNRQKQKTLSRR